MAASAARSVRPFGLSLVGLPTASEAAAFDRRATREVGVSEPVLMENAGRSAALVLERLFPRGSVAALVGAGNNGGDALVLLRTLAAWGRPVRALLAADRELPDPRLHGFDPEVVLDTDLAGEAETTGWLSSSDVVVDGLLGIGISGPPRQRQSAAIRGLRASGRPVLALDVPSGVDATTGAVPGEAVEAVATVAFGWPKLGTLLHPGRARCGRLLAVEIGFPPHPDGGFPTRLITPGWVTARRPRRPPRTHKNAVGSLLLVVGAPGMAGAALMSAGAALRSGVGLLRVASAPENRTALQTGLPEAIFVDWSDDAAVDGALERSTALGAGPGVGTGEAAAKLLGRLLRDGPAVPTVLDADALNLVGEERLPGLEATASGRPLVVTPHPGEMSRIGPGTAEDAIERPVDVAREAAGRTGAVVLLKGTPSVVAAPNGRVWVDAVGSSDLATAGMGDVLTGTVGALLAQGLAPVEAAGVGLHWSGRAARRCARGAGLLPRDVIRALPEAALEEGPGESDLGLPFVVFDQDPPG